jgi:hypothetical protein
MLKPLAQLDFLLKETRSVTQILSPFGGFFVSLSSVDILELFLHVLFQSISKIIVKLDFLFANTIPEDNQSNVGAFLTLRVSSNPSWQEWLPLMELIERAPLLIYPLVTNYLL